MVLNKMFALLFVLAVSLADLTDCITGLKTILANAPGSFSTHPNNYAKMFSYSGKNLNQLGLFEDCYRLSNASYVLFKLRQAPLVLLSICGPEICTASDYESILASIANSTSTELRGFEAFGLGPVPDLVSSAPLDASALSLASAEVIFPESYIHTRFNGLNKGGAAMVAIVVILGSLGLVATFVDLKTKQDEEELLKTNITQIGISEDDFLAVPHADSMGRNILISFSFARNMKRLLSPHKDDYHPHLYIFDGIRVITMGWIILGACGSYIFGVVPLANVVKQDSLSKQYFLMPISSAIYALDALFWVGGFLYAYFLLDSFSASPSHWLKIYFKHYLEMVPLFLFVTFFFWALARYLGSGPFWYTGNDIYADCPDYWWTNMFFISNIVPHGTWSQCIAQGWFLSVEMQFFLLTPPLIWVYKKSPFAGWLLVCFYVGLGIICGGLVAHHFDLGVALNGPHSWAYYNYYNNKPYVRVPPYVIGIASGFIYFTSATGNEDKISKCVIKVLKNVYARFATLGLGIFLWLLMINLPFEVYQDPGNDFQYDKWSLDRSTAYLAFVRSILGVSYSLMFTPMVLGYFGYLASILSSQAWAPLSRLTFCVFLVHISVIDIYMRSLLFPKYGSKMCIFVDFVGMTIMSYFVAVLFALMIDIPVKTFILWAFGKKNSTENYFEIND